MATSDLDARSDGGGDAESAGDGDGLASVDGVGESGGDADSEAGGWVAASDTDGRSDTGAGAGRPLQDFRQGRCPFGVIRGKVNNTFSAQHSRSITDTGGGSPAFSSNSPQ